MADMKTLTINGKTYTVSDPNAIRKGVAIFCEKAGDTVTITDATNDRVHNLKLYGKTTQNGTPTPDTPLAFDDAGKSGTIKVSVGTSASDTKPQTLNVPTPNGLPGVPVTSGGNYTDDNGQSWMCDEVDLARGKYIQRVDTYTTNADTNWRKNGGDSNYINTTCICLFVTISGMTTTIRGTLCDRFQYGDAGTGYTKINMQRNLTGQSSWLINADKARWSDLDAWKTWAADNPITVRYVLATSVERDLTAKELIDYSVLYTNKPTTVVTNNAGAGVGIEYVADTKTYIDNKFAELAAAIVNNA